MNSICAKIALTAMKMSKQLQNFKMQQSLVFEKNIYFCPSGISRNNH